MIQVEHLTKCYGDVTAVDDLSFEIEGGHVYGFLVQTAQENPPP